MLNFTSSAVKGLPLWNFTLRPDMQNVGGGIGILPADGQAGSRVPFCE